MLEMMSWVERVGDVEGTGLADVDEGRGLADAMARRPREAARSLCIVGRMWWSCYMWLHDTGELNDGENRLLLIYIISSSS